MLPDIKHFQVNWVDGMKISSGDFIAFENAVFEQVRDSRACRLNEFEYGLLPTNNPEIDNYPKLVFDYANSLLTLKECRALTPGGQRIEITEDNFKRKKYPVKQPAVAIELQDQGIYDVYISIDTSKRVGSGEFAGNNPPRFSVVAPFYELSVKAHDENAMANDNFLKISEIEILNGRVTILTSNGKYIPACTCISALSSLKQIYYTCEDRLKGNIQHHTKMVVKMRDSTNKSALEIKALTEKIILPIVNSLSYYKYMIVNQPPIAMVAYFKDYFRTVKFHLDQEFQAKVINENKLELSSLIAEFEKKEPDHFDIMKSLSVVTSILEKLDSFLVVLLKYDYDAWDVVLEDLGRNNPASKPISSPKEKAPEPKSSSSNSSSIEERRGDRRVF